MSRRHFATPQDAAQQSARTAEQADFDALGIDSGLRPETSALGSSSPWPIIWPARVDLRHCRVSWHHYTGRQSLAHTDLA